MKLRKCINNASSIDVIRVYFVFYEYQPSLICLYIFKVACGLLHIQFPICSRLPGTVLGRLCLTCIQMRYHHAFKSVFSPSPPSSLSWPYVKLANQSQHYIFPFGLGSPSSLYRPWWPHAFPQPPPHLAGQPAIAASLLLLTWLLRLTQPPLACDARGSADSCGRVRVPRRLCPQWASSGLCSSLNNEHCTHGAVLVWGIRHWTVVFSFWTVLVFDYP